MRSKIQKQHFWDRCPRHFRNLFFADSDLGPSSRQKVNFGNYFCELRPIQIWQALFGTHFCKHQPVSRSTGSFRNLLLQTTARLLQFQSNLGSKMEYLSPCEPHFMKNAAQPATSFHQCFQLDCNLWQRNVPLAEELNFMSDFSKQMSITDIQYSSASNFNSHENSFPIRIPFRCFCPRENRFTVPYFLWK